MSVPATVIEPSDAGRCAALLQAGIKALARKGYAAGDLAQIQATFLVAFQGGQTLSLGAISAPALHDVTLAHDGADDEDLLDLTAAARQAGISRPTLYRRLDRGEICPVIVGGRRFIRRQDLGRGFR